MDVHNVHAYILGEHGDSEFAARSMTHIAGMSMDRSPQKVLCGPVCPNWLAERAKIEQAVRDSAYHIIDYKGVPRAYHAVGLALFLDHRVASILRNEHSVRPDRVSPLESTVSWVAASVFHASSPRKGSTAS